LIHHRMGSVGMTQNVERDTCNVRSLASLIHRRLLL
jgi:hypothetical protein